MPTIINMRGETINIDTIMATTIGITGIINITNAFIAGTWGINATNIITDGIKGIYTTTIEVTIISITGTITIITVMITDQEITGEAIS